MPPWSKWWAKTNGSPRRAASWALYPLEPRSRICGEEVGAGVAADVVEIGRVMVEIPAEDLVGRGAADRDAIPRLGDRLLEKPVGVIRDGKDRRVVLPDIEPEDLTVLRPMGFGRRPRRKHEVKEERIEV